MPFDRDLKTLSMLQPDLLTTEDLILKIQSRCRIKNLELMSKEGLIGLFRRVILPLPQRFYRTNRRGKMLSSRRVKAGLESSSKDEGCSREKCSSGDSTSKCRLEPPSNNSDFHKIRISSHKIESDCLHKSFTKRSGELKLTKDEIARPDSFSGRKITLKRRSVDEKLSTQTKPSSECKKQRIAIKWP